MDFHRIHMFQPSVTKGYLLASCTKVLGDESHLISQFWCISTFWTSIPGKQGQQIFGLLSSWNFHHVNMALVGGPMFLSNNMHTPIFATHGKSPLLQTRWACIVFHMIFNKGILMVFPMTAWLSHNKQLIRTKKCIKHSTCHNSF